MSESKSNGKALNDPKEMDVEEPFIVNPNGKNKDGDESESSGCCKCTKKKCGIIAGIILGLLVLIVAAGALRFYASLTGTATSKDSEEWNKKLKDDEEKTGQLTLLRNVLDGDYELVSFSENYQSFLTTMGLPTLIAKMILMSSERVFISQPEKGSDPWTVRVKTDTSDRSVSFLMNAHFEEIVGSRTKKTFNKTCSLTANTLTCDGVEVGGTNFHIKSTSVFTKLGFVESKTLVGSNLTAQKYFKRISILEVLHNMNELEDPDLENNIKKAKEQEELDKEANPFKNTGDDDFEDF